MQSGAAPASRGGVETVSTIYLVDSNGTLAGAVPLAKLVLPRVLLLLSLTREPLIASHVGATDKEVAELFDTSHNLLTLPVIDESKSSNRGHNFRRCNQHAARQTLALRLAVFSSSQNLDLHLFCACFVMTRLIWL